MTVDNPASYEFDSASAVTEPPEPYVRAKVVDSRGDVAWVQPVFVEAP